MITDSGAGAVQPTAGAPRRKGAGPTDLHLDPYLVHIGAFGIRWYGFFMMVSMVCGIWFLIRHARRCGVDEDHVYNLAFAMIVGGVIGARLVYVITNWSFFARYPAAILRIYQGGLSIHGAMIGGLALGLWYAARTELPFWALADGAVPGACIGIYLVRIGNIFNGEILGHHAGILGGARHPAQVYEMAMGLGLWFIYWRIMRQRPADGVPFWTFIFWYGVLRFMSEGFRDNPQYLIHYTNHYLGIGVITLTQWFTPLILAIGWIGRRWRQRVGLHSSDGPLPAAPWSAVPATGIGTGGSERDG